MVDIPQLLKLKAEKETQERILQLKLLIASNQRTMEDKEYKQFIEILNPKQVSNQFNRDRVEQLRAMSGGRG
ncbi:hypothetical protein ACF3OH_11900 [Chryseomicrobium aureum]|uniref:hypothetical protein n=1 Tax=Chryseomicrobium aureum TaxID=1441723 RepID=UPI00370D3AEA